MRRNEGTVEGVMGWMERFGGGGGPRATPKVLCGADKSRSDSNRAEDTERAASSLTPDWPSAEGAIGDFTSILEGLDRLSSKKIVIR